MKWRIFAVLMIAAFAYADISLNANITALHHSSIKPNALFVGTDAGEIVEYDLAQKKFNPQFLIRLSRVQNYYEKDLGARIHSFDMLDNAFLLVSEGNFGTQNISVCKNFKIKAEGNTGCATIKSPFANIKKAFFIDKNTALFVLLSSDIKLVDLKDFANVGAKKERTIPVLKEFKFSHTSLNDAVLDEQKQNLLVASESGELQVFDIKAWKLLANYNKIHKDTLDQVDFKSGVIISCGKEKKVGIVKAGKQRFLQKNSLVYACALSPSGEVAAFASNTAGKESVELINTANLQSVKLFDDDFFAKFIIFLNENDLAIAGGSTILLRNAR